jgi:alginate export protein
MRRVPLVARRWLASACLLALWPAASVAAQDAAPRAPSMPAWLDLAGDYRTRIEGVEGSRFQSGNDDAYVLSRLRLSATFLASPDWRVVFQAQDSRVFLKADSPSRPPFRDVVDARLAYVELGRRTDATWTARIGRQELAFGEQRLIGNADWLNTGRTFDAVRATRRWPRVTVDAFGGYVLRVMPDQLNRPDAGNLLYGVNIVVTRVVPGVTVEPYLFAHRAPNQAQEDGGRDTAHSATIGTRWIATSLGRVDASGEVAAQFGSIGADTIRAWASHWTAGMTFAGVRGTPRLFGEYNVASGDENRHDGRRQTFDQLYATGHDKYGLADQVGWRNIHHVRGGVDVHPSGHVVATARYHSWWLASTADALYDASGAVLAQPLDASGGRHVGQELDVQATLLAPRNVKMAAGYAHIFPGSLLQQATPGHSYSYPYLSFNVGF